MKTLKYILIGSFLLVLPAMTMAQVNQPQGITNFTMQSIYDIIYAVLRWAAAIIFILGTLMLLYAAFLFLTSAGDDTKVAKAKKTLLYGLIGIGVALLAYAAWSFVDNFLRARF